MFAVYLGAMDIQGQTLCYGHKPHNAFHPEKSESIFNTDFQDGDEKDEEKDLLEPPCTATTVGSDDEKTDTPATKKTLFPFINPFAKKKKPEESSASSNPEGGDVPLEKRPGFLHAIKLPLVNVLPRKLRSTKEPDVEEGSSTPSKPAGLASMETLDDSNGSTKHSDEKGEEGLETVKLDSSEEKAALESEKNAPEKKPWDREAIIARLAPLKEYQYIIGGVLLFLILLIIIIIIAVSGPRTLTSSPIIDGRYVRAVTSCGPVEGLLEDGAIVFRGIPYARPPVGERRWRAPEKFTLESCWNGTLKTHNSSDTCWQVYNNGTINGREDCLTLDIVTPQVRYINPLPVVVLFGAESLSGGSPGRLDLPSPRLSRIRDVVFVKPNFRMGVLGYLAAKALSNSTYPFTSGNYGMHDAVEALRWVKNNIVHFAGDPEAITVLGHRAGATMLTAIAASHKVEKLFTRAWLASGSASFPGIPLAESEQESLPYIRALDCNERDDQCLRQKDVEELIDNVPDDWVKVDHDLPRLDENITSKHQWLVVDGVVIKEHPLEVWKQGNLSVKIVMGTTAHADATKALYTMRPEWTEEEVKAKVANSILGYNQSLTSEVFKRYNTSWTSLAAIVSEIRTICPLLNLASQLPSTPFYVVTEPRGEHRVADVNADVDAILERYNPKTPEQRRYVSAIQQIFYRFVSLGKFDHHPSDASNNKILLIGQDALPNLGYPNCDFWFAKDIVPRFARID
ncbi:neurotactin-like [Macrosteles quadrilineatus]|uniref:neurotactin-like n=1 Tax=Macrosteles quadrilineatus TaxID=74068 RepID=UPI0023E1B3FB|nr:neurotactin-like [Macrosteles quadrilineatus]